MSARLLAILHLVRHGPNFGPAWGGCDASERVPHRLLVRKKLINLFLKYDKLSPGRRTPPGLIKTLIINDLLRWIEAQCREILKSLLPDSVCGACIHY